MGRHTLMAGVLSGLLLTVSLLAMPLARTGAGSPATLPAAAAAPGYAVIFEDGFDDGSTVQWSIQTGWEAQEESNNWFLRATSEGEASLLTPITRSTYRFRADVRLTSGTLGLAYRTGDEWYVLRATTTGLDLQRASDTASTPLGSSSDPIAAGDWHTIEISGTLDHLQALVDGDVRIDCIDPTPQYAGSIGLVVYGGATTQIDLDNLQILVPESAEPPWTQTGGPCGGGVNTIEIDPDHPDTLYAGGAGGGIFKTTNGGATWAMLPQIVAPSQVIDDILLSAADSQTLYVLAHQLYKSTNGGTTWRVSDSRIPFSCLAQEPGNASVLVAGTGDGRVLSSPDAAETWVDVTGNLPGDGIADVAIGAHDEYWAGTSNGSAGRLYHTVDGGTHWDEVDIGQRADTDIHTLYVDSEHTGTIYVGLIDVHRIAFDALNDRYLLKSQDGGTSWDPLHLPAAQAMINVIGIARGDSTLYVGAGPTVFKSDNGGQNWASIGPPGRSGDIYDIAVDPRDTSVLYVPRRASGIAKSTDGGETWSAVNEGLFNVAVSLLAVTDGPDYGTVYATTVNGEGTFKTTDYGNTWANVTEGGITHPWADELVVNPFAPETVWEVADVGNVYVTTDGGTSWNMTIDPAAEGFRYGSVYAVAAAPSAADTLYALKNGFGLFKSVDGGQTWSFLHQSEVDYTYSIAVHPTNPDIVYSGYNPKPFQDWAMVRQTTDGGLTWRTALTVPHASAVTTVAIDPNDPGTVYAGSTGPGGHVWVTHNAGDDWAEANERFNLTNLHVLAADPSDPDKAYAGIWGGGTFRTTDGGQSWGRLPNDPTISASAIVVSPDDSDVIYLADRTSPRIFRTEDGGASWQTYFDAGAGYYRVLNAVLSPSDPNILYASVFTYGGPMAGDVFRIESGSATKVTGSLPRLPVALTVDPLDAQKVYAVLHGYGVFKTINGGGDWSDISTAESELPQSPHVGFNGLVVDPTNTTTLYLIGGCDVDVDYSHSGADPADMNTVYRSDDGGATWENLDDGILGAGSGSVKGLAISPGDPSTLYVGALNGVFRFTDSDDTWSEVNAGLGYTQTSGIALSSDGSRIYAPTLGGGAYAGAVDAATGDVTWDDASHLAARIYNVQVATDPADSGTVYASAYPGGMFKSSDGGLTWAECNFGMASFQIDDPTRQGYYAFAIAPSDPDVLYLGLYGVGMYKSVDGGGIWQPMNGSAQTMCAAHITSLLIDPSDGDIVYVATENGVFQSSDGGGHWGALAEGPDCTDVRVLAIGSDGTLYAGTRGYEMYAYDATDPAWRQLRSFANFGIFWPIWNDRPLYQYTTLLFHPADPDLIYFGTFPAGIYKSTDGGQSWRESNVGWTNDGVFSLVVHPENPGIIYAGTYNGVNRTLDGGAHWEKWAEGWPSEQWVFSLDFDPRDADVMYACSKNGENEGTGREGFHGTVMKTLDGGASWFPITTGLNLDQELYKILVDRDDPDTLYLATQKQGVFISRDGGALWLPWNEGLTNPVAATNGNNVTNTMVFSADGRYVYFGTAGSGVFRRALGGAPAQLLHLPLILKTAP